MYKLYLPCEEELSKVMQRVLSIRNMIKKNANSIVFLQNVFLRKVIERDKFCFKGVIFIKKR